MSEGVKVLNFASNNCWPGLNLYGHVSTSQVKNISVLDSAINLSLVVNIARIFPNEIVHSNLHFVGCLPC